MDAVFSKPVFNLGAMHCTPSVLQLYRAGRLDIHQIIARHHHGDWGDLSDQDKTLNDHALLMEPGRLLSRYVVDEHIAVYVITEVDRSCTTILRTEEY